MRVREDPPPALLRLADAQHGMVSADQIGRIGFGRHAVARLVHEGRWQRLARGLLFTGPQDPTWTGLAWGGVLLGGDQSRLAGAAAGFLHGLIEGPPSRIDLFVPHGTTIADRPPWTFRQERSGVRGRSVDQPPRTGAADTVLDLAETGTEGQVIDLVISAVQSGVATAPAIRRRLGLRHRHLHRRLIVTLLEETEEGIESTLERDYLRHVERPHGLPASEPQHLNAVLHRRDRYYKDFGVVAELDGQLAHRGRRFRDLHRDNIAAVLGETTVRFGFWDVHEVPCLIARQVGAVLARRGWLGVLVTCPRCTAIPLTEVLVP